MEAKVDIICKLYDEIEEYKKMAEEGKAKASGADKASFEMKKLKDQLEDQRRQREIADRVCEDYKKEI